MIGKGLKQIPSYKCTVPYNELNRINSNNLQLRRRYSRKFT